MLTEQQTSDLLDGETQRTEEDINLAIEALELEIVQILLVIAANKNGNIAGQSKTLAQAKAAIKQLTALLATYADTSTDYRAINKAVVPDISKTSRLSLALSVATLRSAQRSLASSTASRLSNAIYDHVANGKSRTSLINAVTGIVTGSSSISGRPMASHAKQISVDGLMEYYSAAFKIAAEKEGVTQFKYSGSLIKDSRQWCVDHLNKVYTKEEIDAFDDDSWAGQKDGSTFVVRGGYNCRHWWVSVRTPEALPQ